MQIENFSSRGFIRGQAVLAIFLLASATGVFAQDDIFDGSLPSSKKAVAVFDINAESVFGNATISTMLAASGIETFGPPLPVAEYKKLKRITLFLGPYNIRRDLFDDFVARIKVKDSEQMPELVEQLFPFDYDTVVEDGWTVCKIRQEWPKVLRFKGDVLEFGTHLYCYSPTRSIASERLIAGYTAMNNDAMFRATLDSQVISQSLQNLLRSEDAERRALRSMLEWGEFVNEGSTLLYLANVVKYVSTISLEADLEQDEIAKLKIVPMKGREKIVNAQATVLFDWLEFHLQLPVEFLKQNESPIAGIVEKLATGLKMTTSEDGVAIDLSQPEDLSSDFVKVFQKMTGGVSLRKDSNTMKQLAIANHNYHDTFRRFPMALDKFKRVSEDLSWRVKIMPFCELNAEYERMDLSKPWDAEVNQAVVAAGKQMFHLSDGSLVCGIKTDPPVETFGSIIDGSSNTIMLIQNKGLTMTSWTKPSDLDIDEAVEMVMDLKKGEYLWVALYDGSTSQLHSPSELGITKKEVRNMFDPRDQTITRLRELLQDGRPRLLPKVPALRGDSPDRAKFSTKRPERNVEAKEAHDGDLPNFRDETERPATTKKDSKRPRRK